MVDGNGNVALALIEERQRNQERDLNETRRDVKYLSTHSVQITNDHLARIVATEKSQATTALLIKALTVNVTKLAETVTEHQDHKVTMIERWKAHKAEHVRENATLGVINTAITAGLVFLRELVVK